MDKKHSPTSIRFTEDTKFLLELLTKKLGINRTAVIEMAVHRLADQENVKSTQKQNADQDQ